MDNFKYFCHFFGIDHLSHYGKLTDNFKTLYPEYFLNNELIQDAVHKATGKYEPMFDAQGNMIRKKKDSELNYRIADSEDPFSQKEADLNFREQETFAMIEFMEYQQDQYIQIPG